MNTSGEVADLMVKEGLQITEEVVKLTGLGAKNLAAIIIALLKEDNKLQGKTNLKKLLKSDKQLFILQIKESDIGKFNAESKRYGVLFTAVKDRTNDSGLCDIIAKQDDVTKLNYIMEKLGYNTPELEPEPEIENEEAVKQNPRAKENQQENEYMRYGDSDKTDNRTDERISIKKRLQEIKEKQKNQKKEKHREKGKTMFHSQKGKKKKKNKTKGR